MYVNQFRQAWAEGTGLLSPSAGRTARHGLEPVQQHVESTLENLLMVIVAEILSHGHNRREIALRLILRNGFDC